VLFLFSLPPLVHTLSYAARVGMNRIAAILVSDDGLACEIMVSDDSGQFAMRPIRLPETMPADVWQAELTHRARLNHDASHGFAFERGLWLDGGPAPFMVNSLAATVESYRSMTLQRCDSYGERRELRKLGKVRRGLRLKQIPPPNYYVITLRDTINIERPDAEGRGRMLYQGFQAEVRGHDKVYVKRGPLPLAASERDKLRKRGYRVFERGEIDPEAVVMVNDLRKRPSPETPLRNVLEALSSRGRPWKQKHEWLAIKVTRVDAFWKGPPDAPKRIATRVVPLRDDNWI
jgi:hypothetical protein